MAGAGGEGFLDSRTVRAASAESRFAESVPAAYRLSRLEAVQRVRRSLISKSFGQSLPVTNKRSLGLIVGNAVQDIGATALAAV